MVGGLSSAVKEYSVDLAQHIRNVPDFPVEGIQFKDITTLLQSPEPFAASVDAMLEHYQGTEIDVVVGIESRGFIWGAVLAYKLGVGVTLVRKPGKLPADVRQVTYDLEYGTDTLEIHEDAFNKGDKVLIADDLLATGGTVAAVVKLVEELGAEIVECTFMAELDFLEGRKRLPKDKVFSLLHF